MAYENAIVYESDENINKLEAELDELEMKIEKDRQEAKAEAEAKAKAEAEAKAKVEGIAKSNQSTVALLQLELLG